MAALLGEAGLTAPAGASLDGRVVAHLAAELPAGLLLAGRRARTDDRSDLGVTGVAAVGGEQTTVRQLRQAAGGEVGIVPVRRQSLRISDDRLLVHRYQRAQVVDGLAVEAGSRGL